VRDNYSDEFSTIFIKKIFCPISFELVKFSFQYFVFFWFFVISLWFFFQLRVFPSVLWIFDSRLLLASFFLLRVFPSVMWIFDSRVLLASFFPSNNLEYVVFFVSVSCSRLGCIFPRHGTFSRVNSISLFASFVFLGRSLYLRVFFPHVDF